MKREVANKLLLLKLISLTDKIDAQKLNHLVFVLEHEGRKERKRTFNYAFVKWNIEPYCQELEQDIEHLSLEKLIQSEQGIFLTEKGKNYLKQYEHLLQTNKVNSFFKFYLYIYADLPLYQLADTIFKKYELGQFQNKDVVIQVIQEENIRQKIELEEVKEKIHLTYDELERKDEMYMKRIQSIMKEFRSESKNEKTTP